MKGLSVFVFLALLAGSAAQLKAFVANVVISNMNGVDGSLNASLSYDYNLKLMATRYTVGPTEYLNFTSRLRYLVCGSQCDTSTYAAAQPIYFIEPTDTVTTKTYKGCTQHVKASTASGVASIYVDATSTICRAVWTDGHIVDFSMVTASTLTASSYQAPTTCPQPLCSKKIDFEMLSDESGSILGPDFQIMKNFVSSVAKSYTFGNNYVGMGLTLFGTTARQVVPLTFSQSAFIQALGRVYQYGGSTCIGCGISTAWQDVSTKGRLQPDNKTPVTRVFIVITDGDNTIGDFTVPLNQAKAQGVIFFCIGVGDYIEADVHEIASDIAGVNTTFFGDRAAGFKALPGILNGLILATCVDIPGNACGTGCRGFCSCKQTCICPDICDDGNACTDDSCTAGIAGNGCIHSTTDCDDGDLCTDDFCNINTGCYYNTTVCVDGNLCTDDMCYSDVGCVFSTTDCSDGSPCTNDTCNPKWGCNHTEIANCSQICNDPTKPIVCPPINCMINECNPFAGGRCDARPRTNCVDTNPCTVDSCNATTNACQYLPKMCSDGNACTIDSCNITNGACVSTPFNVSVVCNDYSACTIDYCDKQMGCAHKNVSCDDNNTCTIDTCNSIYGCQHADVDCWSYDANLIAHPDLAACYEAVCVNGPDMCKLIATNSSKFDACGVCNGDGSTCILALGSSQTIGIGAGVIAAIVIGAVLVCAAIGALSGKKGYDVWLKHRTNMQGANTSPLYSSEGLSGTNPMYTGDTA